ncbi:hypothetical protein ABZV15_07920 [Streptomyces sp. NPDC005246]|uniref:hypothetical protein n=1 Tax=Streptomyces sp. NPDC005246 TaxID=3156716 RepID=UPI0033B7D718
MNELLAALIGAIVGGGASFLGAWWQAKKSMEGIRDERQHQLVQGSLLKAIDLLTDVEALAKRLPDTDADPASRRDWRYELETLLERARISVTLMPKAQDEVRRRVVRVIRIIGEIDYLNLHRLEYHQDVQALVVEARTCLGQFVRGAAQPNVTEGFNRVVANQERRAREDRARLASTPQIEPPSAEPGHIQEERSTP